MGPRIFGTDAEISARAARGSKGEQGSYHTVDEDEGAKKKTVKMNNHHDRSDCIASLLCFPLMLYYIFADVLFSGAERGAGARGRWGERVSTAHIHERPDARRRRAAERESERERES